MRRVPYGENRSQKKNGSRWRRKGGGRKAPCGENNSLTKKKQFYCIPKGEKNRITVEVIKFEMLNGPKKV